MKQHIFEGVGIKFNRFFADAVIIKSKVFFMECQ
jgi:hypothetical protein